MAGERPSRKGTVDLKLSMAALSIDDRDRKPDAIFEIVESDLESTEDAHAENAGPRRDPIRHPLA